MIVPVVDGVHCADEQLGERGTGPEQGGGGEGVNDATGKGGTLSDSEHGY